MSSGSGWRLYCCAEVTELSANKQHTLAVLFSMPFLQRETRVSCVCGCVSECVCVGVCVCVCVCVCMCAWTLSHLDPWQSWQDIATQCTL
jgi:hypothetical protein